MKNNFEILVDVCNTLTRHGIKNFTHWWNGEFGNVLELNFESNEDYDKAFELISSDESLDDQCVVGLIGDNLLCIQFPL